MKKETMYPSLRNRWPQKLRSASKCVTIENVMSPDWIGSGFEEDSAEELARSMEHEIEGLLELDDFDLPSASPVQPLPADIVSSRAADRPGRVT